MNLKLLCATALMTLVATGSLFAQQDDTRINGLLEHIKQLEGRIAELENTRREEPVSALERQINALTTGEMADDNEFTATWGGSRKFSTANKAFQLTTGGRIMNDYHWGFQDDDYKNHIVADASNAPLGPFKDGTEFRRARLYIKGVLYSRVIFKLDFGFEKGDADFKDAYIGVKGLPTVGTVMVGQFKIPFGLEYMASSRFITFNERSMGSDAFIADRGTGIRMHNTAFEDDRLAWFVSVYREADTYGNTAVPEDGQYNFAARVTGLPWYEDNGRKLLHLGAAINIRNPSQPGNGLSRVRFRSKPEAHQSPRVVDTGNFEAEGVFLWNVEIALVLGSFSAQGEMFYAMVESDFANDPEFYGFNFYVSYFLTGEYRAYKKSAGAFSRVKVNNNFLDGEGGIGAWEVALRFSTIDLNDEVITGGEAWTITFGLTWYLNPNTQVKLNYIYANLNDGAGGSQEGEAHIIGMRFQIDF